MQKNTNSFFRQHLQSCDLTNMLIIIIIIIIIINTALTE